VAGPGNILIKIGADAGQAVRELATVNKSLGATATSGEKMHAGLTKAALPAAAALAAIGYASIDAAKAAAEDAAAQQRLAGVLERSTGASDAQIKSTEDWIAATARATGVSDEKLRPSLAKLAMATHDLGLSQKDLQIALDVSAATGKDVVTVSNAIAKGYGGQVKGLKTLVPGMDAATLKSKDMNAIMLELAATTGGAMAEQAGTAAGQFAIFKDQTAELQEKLGAGLLPVLNNLLPIMLKLIDFASKNTTAITILIGVVAALSAGILIANAALKAYQAMQLAVKVATTAWTAVQWLLNAALAANPIGLVIVAVAALAAGIVIAYKHSETFRHVVTAAFDAVLAAARAVASGFTALWNAARAAFDWITAHWQLIAPLFGPIGIAILLVVRHFDTLKSAAVAVFDAIKSAVSGIADAIGWVISQVERLIGAIGRIKVPHIDLPGPLLAPPTPPLTGRAAPGAYATAGPTINVYGAIDPEGTARAILKVLRGHERRQGRF
jgi:hypothetical protein